jgi:thiamine biosynthesis lipoprotein
MILEDNNQMKLNWKRRQVLQMAGALVLSPVFPGWGRGALPVLSGPTMGTHYKVHIQQVPDNLYLPKLKRSIERVLETTEALMSTYRSTSELSRFNSIPSVDWQEISPDTRRVVNAALQVQKLSVGAFNPATGPLVDYWGFGAKPAATPDTENPPPENLLDKVIDARIEIDSSRIRKNHPQAALDLNAIAKGDAIDGVARALQQFGVNDYLIEVGGEVRVLGAGPSGSGWIVGLENPSGENLVGVRLAGGAIATSGDYVDYFNRNGKRYSHLIDPRSGKPVDHDLALVNVIANNAMQADAWSTALMVMGVEDGFQTALENKMAALFLKRDAGSYKMVMTPEFENYL